MIAQAGVAVLTVSDTRTAADDPSGDLLREGLKAAGHRLAGSAIVADDIRRIRNRLWRWIADPQIDAVIATAGTEVGSDGTIQVVRALLDVERPSFAERFEALPHSEDGAAAARSGAIAGAAGGTAIFALPGSESAVRLAWTHLLCDELAHAVGELRR
ncbi:MAG: Molybdenum cofactor biosynthesis protein MoaB [uncultured Solirubrobacteraceae bacterium]|uniref:Molybdenum cofactor biosynthesis protein B n=1 Tax=uncultured Solirubrobacteraceae bacterium TaxID=1162706 RepID=A0A6J4SRQ3_9ACTN|nr:MAG: Molybdenum cofactor biosynthesis protein MoaB [uncultured Solirubrobacteraceae bacterium]